MIQDTISETIRAHELVRPGDHIILGFSGGPDSLTLFSYFFENAKKLGITLHIVHVNHQLRGEASEQDQKFVENLAARAGLSCRTTVFDCAAYAKEHGLTVEEAGRRVRYQSFDEEARRICGQGAPDDQVRIAVAHNLDDQIETILLRLIRGTGVDGLAGMDYLRTDEAGFAVIRPLLDVSKKEILSYCNELGISPRKDETNGDPSIARNRIRLELLPELEKYNPNIRAALLRLRESAAEDRAHLGREAREAAASAVKEFRQGALILDGEKLRGLDPAIRKRVLVLALRELGLTSDFTFSHLSDIDRLLSLDGPSARVDLPHGYYACREYEDLKLVAPGSAEHDFAPVAIDVSTFDVSELHERTKGKEKGSFAVFDLDKVRALCGKDASEAVTLRTREPGDRIAIRLAQPEEEAVDGEGLQQLRIGRKKMQDVFVDRKVPKDLRDRVRYCAAGSDVLFVPESTWAGLPAMYAADLFVDEHTKMVLLVETFWAL